MFERTRANGCARSKCKRGETRPARAGACDFSRDSRGYPSARPPSPLLFATAACLCPCPASSAGTASSRITVRPSTACSVVRNWMNASRVSASVSCRNRKSWTAPGRRDWRVCSSTCWSAVSNPYTERRCRTEGACRLEHLAAGGTAIAADADGSARARWA